MAVVPLRLRTLGHRPMLDAALADGADPSVDPMLELRARQLTSPATRRALAGTIRRLVDVAEARGRRQPIGSRPPLQAEAVLAARCALLEVADFLADAVAVEPQGAALAARLVWDSASPLYAETDATVEEWAQATLDRLAADSLAA